MLLKSCIPTGYFMSSQFYFFANLIKNRRYSKHNGMYHLTSQSSIVPVFEEKLAPTLYNLRRSLEYGRA